LSEIPNKGYFHGMSVKTGFKMDSLEKMYRLMRLLGRIFELPELADRLALKGGTALHSVEFGFRRLSIDIDLNYTGSVEKERMFADREQIRKLLHYVFRDEGYQAEPPEVMHAEEQFFLHFDNTAGGKDRIKLEINYLERLPILGVARRETKPFFDGLPGISVLTYPAEELFAGKMTALLARATPRDLYDADLIARDIRPFDRQLFRKIIIFNLCLSKQDAREITEDGVAEITEKEIRNSLLPMLPRSERPDIEQMRSRVADLARQVLRYDDREKRFLHAFYVRHKFEGELLFGGFPVAKGLEKHPALLWRLMQLERGESMNR
jgi:predicted nucleotidyltransferase component of viral defense system